MKDNKDSQDQQHDLPDSEISGVDDSRRKFNKAGMIAPVLMSFSSKPVWAATCGVSGTLSGNLSGGCKPPLNGFTATDFLKSTTWPSPYKSTTTFDSVFGSSSKGSLFGRSVTLKNVLKGAEPVAISEDNLKILFNCTGGVNNLKKALKAYAKQSVVCFLNDAIFPNYGYPGTHTFYSAISAVGSFRAKSEHDKITSDSIASLIAKLTADLAALRTT